MKGLKGKLSHNENISLYYLCLKDIYWNTHDTGMNQYNPRNKLNLFSLLYLIETSLVVKLYPYAPIFGAVGVLYSFALIKYYGAKSLLFTLVCAVFAVGSYYFITHPSRMHGGMFEKDKIQFNTNYFVSDWYRNTGIMPSEIIQDSKKGKDRKGIYGEYLATMAMELNIKNNKLQGRVFNSAIIPTKNNSFTEIDIVAVTNKGIAVIEAKDRVGVFSGEGTAKKWKQKIGSQEHELENPLIQNIGHVNALAQYLYDCAEKDSPVRDMDMICTMVNVVAIASTETDFSQVTGKYPVNSLILYDQSYTHDLHTATLSTLHSLKTEFLGRTGDVKVSVPTTRMNDGLSTSNFLEEFGVPLSSQQMDEIIRIIDSRSHFTDEERERMIQERERRWQAGLDRVPSKYTVVTVSFPLGHDHEIINSTTVMRIRGKEKSYCFTELPDNQFRAVPNAKMWEYFVIDERGSVVAANKDRPKKDGEKVYLMNTFEEAMRFLDEIRSKYDENGADTKTNEQEDYDWAF